MLISREMGFEDLEKNSWCGAIDTIKKVREAGKIIYFIIKKYKKVLKMN